MKKIVSGALVASCFSMGQLYGLGKGTSPVTVDDILKKCEQIADAAQMDRFQIGLSCNLAGKFVGPSGLREIKEQRAPTSIRVGLTMGKGDSSRGGESHDTSYTKVYEHNQRGNHTNCQQYQHFAQLAAYEKKFNCDSFKKALAIARAGGRGDQGQQGQGQQGQGQGQQGPKGQSRNIQIPEHMLARTNLDDVAKLCMHTTIDWGDYNQCTEHRNRGLESTVFNPSVSTDSCHFVAEGDVFGCGGSGKGAAGMPTTLAQRDDTDLDFTNNIPAGLLTMHESKYNTIATEQTKDYVNEVRTRTVAHGTCNPFTMCRQEIELLDAPQAETLFGQMGLQKGDRIHMVDGIRFSDADALRKHLYDALSSSREVHVKYYRGKESMAFKSVLKPLAPTLVPTTKQQVSAQL